MDKTVSAPDFELIKAKQKAMWASGDYSIIGTTLQIVGEQLCEAIDLQAGSDVIDVAAGNGNASLAAARRFAHVTSTDYVPELLEKARARAVAEGLAMAFVEADAEALPFPDQSFDVALSVFGVMFTPQPEKAAAELVRVVKRGGSIGLANWTPHGFIGQVLKTVGQYLPPPAGLRPPIEWGMKQRLLELFAGHSLHSEERSFMFRYESAAHWMSQFKSFYGPMNRAFAALDAEKARALEADLLALAASFNTGGTRSLSIPGYYLETVISPR
jgi:ubiquinone/menaquinone biosynthesis C-methylase UbiE